MTQNSPNPFKAARGSEKSKTSGSGSCKDDNYQYTQHQNYHEASNYQNSSYNSNNYTQPTYIQPYNTPDQQTPTPVAFRYNINRVPVYNSQIIDDSLISQLSNEPPKQQKSPVKMESCLTIRDYRLQPAAIVWENGAASGITKTHFIAMKSNLLENKIKSKRGYCSILGGASDTTGINMEQKSKNNHMKSTMKSTAAAKTGSHTERVNQVYY